MKIADVLEELGIYSLPGGSHHHIRLGWRGFDCPLCSPGTGSYKMGVPEHGYVAVCWICGTQSLTEMLHLASGQPYARIRALLGGLDRGGLPPETKPRGRLVLPSGLRPLLPRQRDYLARRGIDPDEAQALWGVQGIGLAKRLAFRIFIPIHDRRGKTQSWTTRSIGKDPLRYVSATPEEEALPRKELLYGEHLAGHAIMVVEGPLDALRIGPGAVATLGVKFSIAQVARIGRFPVRLVCLDNEPQAQKQARKLCAALSGYAGVTQLVEVSAKDPGDTDDDEVRELRRMLR